jgi:hypothetical protein
MHEMNKVNSTMVNSRCCVAIVVLLCTGVGAQRLPANANYYASARPLTNGWL